MNGLISGFSSLLSFVNAKSIMPSRGWGDHIDWHSLEQGRELSNALNKPMMVIIHKMTCHACRNLKHRFSRNTAVAATSKEFVMVNLEIHEVPDQPAYHPDGFYVPRILFFTPTGKALTDVTYGKESYRYSYPDEKTLLNNMKRVLDMK